MFKYNLSDEGWKQILLQQGTLVNLSGKTLNINDRGAGDYTQIQMTSGVGGATDRYPPSTNIPFIWYDISDELKWSEPHIIEFFIEFREVPPTTADYDWIMWLGVSSVNAHADFSTYGVWCGKEMANAFTGGAAQNRNWLYYGGTIDFGGYVNVQLGSYFWIYQAENQIGSGVTHYQTIDNVTGNYTNVLQPSFRQPLNSPVSSAAPAYLLVNIGTVRGPSTNFPECNVKLYYKITKLVTA